MTTTASPEWDSLYHGEGPGETPVPPMQALAAVGTTPSKSDDSHEEVMGNANNNPSDDAPPDDEDEGENDDEEEGAIPDAGSVDGSDIPEAPAEGEHSYEYEISDSESKQLEARPPRVMPEPIEEEDSLAPRVSVPSTNSDPTPTTAPVTAAPTVPAPVAPSPTLEERKSRRGDFEALRGLLSQVSYPPKADVYYRAALNSAFVTISDYAKSLGRDGSAMLRDLFGLYVVGKDLFDDALRAADQLGVLMKRKGDVAPTERRPSLHTRPPSRGPSSQAPTAKRRKRGGELSPAHKVPTQVSKVAAASSPHPRKGPEVPVQAFHASRPQAEAYVYPSYPVAYPQGHVIYPPSSVVHHPSMSYVAIQPGSMPPPPQTPTLTSYYTYEQVPQLIHKQPPPPPPIQSYHGSPATTDRGGRVPPSIGSPSVMHRSTSSSNVVSAAPAWEGNGQLSDLSDPSSDEDEAQSSQVAPVTRYVPARPPTRTVPAPPRVDQRWSWQEDLGAEESIRLPFVNQSQQPRHPPNRDAEGGPPFHVNLLYDSAT